MKYVPTATQVSLAEARHDKNQLLNPHQERAFDNNPVKRSMSS
jgi:hypothetical protein